MCVKHVFHLMLFSHIGKQAYYYIAQFTSICVFINRLSNLINRLIGTTQNILLIERLGGVPGFETTFRNIYSRVSIRRFKRPRKADPSPQPIRIPRAIFLGIWYPFP
jgi:hypothetical protein